MAISPGNSQHSITSNTRANESRCDQGRIKGLLGLGLNNIMGLCLSDNNKQQNRFNILAAKIFLKHHSVTLRQGRRQRATIGWASARHEMLLGGATNNIK